jgi:Skp family chaperone for outer membrane proteins
MMPQAKILGRFLAISAAVLSSLSAQSVSAESTDSKVAPLFAVVDFQKLTTSFKAKDSIETDLRTMQQKFDAQLARRDNMPFLSEDEQKQLDSLYEKATKTDADTNKIKELENKNKQKSEEIQAIRQKKDTELNDADRAKLKAADEAFREAQKKFVQLKDDLSNQISQFGKSKSDELMSKIKGTIAKIAEQKGYAVVFSSEVALFSGSDITDQVVGDLNKNSGNVKAPENKAGATFAVVDFQKISAGYKAKDAVETDLRTMQQKFDAQLARRDTMPFLTEDEQKQLDAIYDKPTKSDADNNKVKELETKNKQKSEEIEPLRAKKENELNETEKAKLKAASEKLGEAKKRFDQLKEDLTTQLNQFGKSKSETLMTKVKAAISKVAADKSIAMVFTSEVALYAGMDITDQVISELNKK